MKAPNAGITFCVTHDLAATAGVDIEARPKHNPEYRIYHFFLRDPNGYLIEIQRFEDPRWPA